MTDWQKASHAMTEALGNAYDGWADKEATPTNWARAEYGLKEVLEAARQHGLVLLPVKPTEGMVDAGVALALNLSVHIAGGHTEYVQAFYSHLLAAAAREWQ